MTGPAISPASIGLAVQRGDDADHVRFDAMQRAIAARLMPLFDRGLRGDDGEQRAG